MSTRQVWVPANSQSQSSTPSSSENNNSNTRNGDASRRPPRYPRRGRGGKKFHGDASRKKQPHSSSKDEKMEVSDAQPVPNGKETITKETTTTTTTSTSPQMETKKSSKELETEEDNSQLKKAYLQSKANEPKHSALAADIIERLTSDVIRRQVAVWSCSNCYILFHLYCIKKWSKASDEDEGTKTWRCPGCQFVYKSKPVPKCFCGKVVDPPFNAYVTPHSCGETCGKKRKNTDCPHPCGMMCHPGHCPPCAALGPNKTCFCGKTNYRLRCGEKDKGKSCGNICGKKLNCGNHSCEQVCHEGACTPCAIKTPQICYCGKLKEDRPCGSGKLDQSSKTGGYFCCGDTCAKTLPCGKHKCEKKCHPGACGSCPYLPSTVVNCPCGKIPLPFLSEKPRKSCMDPIPTCNNICGKMLPCGTHTCPSKCHGGACPECKVEVRVWCRCHSSSTTMTCAAANSAERKQNPLTCHKTCKTLRNCGRHQCGNMCCPASPQADPSGVDVGGVHICNLMCEKKLKCGKHRCDLLCHSGKCPPCHKTTHEAYVCECGNTRVEPPILCGTKLPACPFMCIRPRPCGHSDKHLCHSRESQCPPCTHLVERKCMGGHEIKKNVLCHATQVSCGRVCGMLLPCNAHTCKRVCHAGPCRSAPLDAKLLLEGGTHRFTMESTPAPSTSTSCGQVCGRKLKFCGHTCQAVCHGEQPCPRIPCKHQITIYCPCKRRSVEVECLRGGEDDREDKAQRQLPCDEQCEIEERNRKLAAALGISTIPTTIYPELLLQVGRASTMFVQRVERKLEDLAKGTPGQKVSFQGLDRIQRSMVHELARVYHMDSESYDKEPNRTLVVTKRRDSKVPTPLLSQVIAELAKQPSHPGAPPGSTTFVLHITDLNPNIKTEHLISFLVQFEGYYQLKWLDDFNALVIFRDYNRMRNALQLLLAGHFHVEEYRDVVDEEGNPKVRQPQPQPAKPLPEFKHQEHAWKVDNNYFSALKKNTNQKKDQADDMWGDEEEDLKFNKESTVPKFVVPTEQHELKERRVSEAVSVASQSKTQAREVLDSSSDWEKVLDEESDVIKP